MSNPFLQLQTDAAAQLATHVYLAGIPVVTESVGDIVAEVQMRLTKGALRAGAGNKIGIAIAVVTPAGHSLDPVLSTEQGVRLDFYIYFNPLFNDGASGFQKPPTDVFWAVLQSMLTWDRGAGNRHSVRLLDWDVVRSPKNEIRYYASFEISLFLNLDAAIP